MQKKQLVFNIQGIAQDVLKPEVNSKFAYSIKNMRLTATKDSNLLSLTTEKGTLGLNTVGFIDETTHSSAISLVGKFLGACILQDNLILFTKDNTDGAVNPDYIYRLFFHDYGSGDTDISQNRISYQLLYQGNLNFSLEHPIEAIASYENEKSQKVYWIDGLNQPRVINITKSYLAAGHNYVTDSYTYDPFSFTQEIELSPSPADGDNKISVAKEFFGGVFNAGVVQYAYCYFNSNMQESNIVDFTPLYYISFYDRGEEPGKQVSCSFNITINSNAQDVAHFDYIRVFQIYSTSLDTMPNVKVIKDIDTSKLNQGNSYTYSFVDSNEFQIDTSEYELQLVKQFIVPQVIVSKDDTLFLGNFKSNFVVNKTDLSSLASEPQFTVGPERLLTIDDGSKDLNVYKYKNQLDKSSRDIKTFKYGEHYKFGVQFQNKYGQWSEPYFLADVTNDQHIENYYATGGTCRIPYAQMSMADIYNEIMSGSNDEEKAYVKARPVVSFPTQNERLVLCQGVLNPTVFNLTERCNGTTYAQASWFFRPYPQVTWEDNAPSYKWEWKDFNDKRHWTYGGATCQFQHYHPLFSSDDIGCELQNMYFDVADEENVNTVGDLVADALDKMWTLSSSLATALKAQVRADWGDPNNPEDIKNDWPIDSEHNSTSVIYSNGEPYRVYVLVLESRYNPADTTKGYLKIRVDAYYAGSGSDILYGLATTPKTIAGNINGSADGLRPYANAYELSSIDGAQQKYSNYYYVDQSVVTMNSPELEFDTNVQSADLSQYSVRIVGYIPLHSNSGTYSISASTPLFKMNWNTSSLGYVRGTYLPTGYYKRPWQLHNYWSGYSGHSMLLSYGCWFDDINGVFIWDGVNHTGWNGDSQEQQYYVHPWQRQYLNNYNHGIINSANSVSSEVSIEDIESSKLSKKVLSNLRFSEKSIYLDTPHHLSSGQVNVFNYDQQISLKLTNDKFYQGNVDQLVVTTSEFVGSGFTGNEAQDPGDTPEFENGLTLQGYPIIVGGRYNQFAGTPVDWSTLVDYYRPRAMCASISDNEYTPNETSTDPILVRYKSSPHFVFQLPKSEYISGKDTFYEQDILPIGIDNGDTPVFAWEQGADWSNDLIWSSDELTRRIVQPTIQISHDTQHETSKGYLWIGEIYRELKAGSPNPFEDNNDEFSLRQRQWVVAGESVDFSNSTTLKWYEGDTFYQRYDCLKTYPFSEEDYQSVVEILSFMCETRINLDGRYDKNRGLLDNTLVDNTNFNLLNPVYNQENNFYTYNILDADIFNANQFANQLTWTLPKLNGAKIDNWTKITLAATADADGSKGEITALRKYNDDIYCFQEGGIGRVLYNERVQISTSDGTPIEIGNSQKFQGIRYISDIVGCQNKWACKETPSGIYFVDNNTPGIYQIAEADKEGSIKPTNITREKYMQSWFETKNVGYFGSWNPNTPTNCWINYDASVDEILITDPYDCLAYSPQLKFFTSFYSYNEIPYITTLGKYPLAIKTDSTIYRLRGGNYSQFFSSNYQDFGLTITAYPYDERSFVRDCVYDNLWYKADEFTSAGIYLPNQSFNYLRAWNEYQNSGVNSGLSYDNQTSNHSNTTLRKKFRMWYARIPRNYSATSSHTDRMRNPWLRLELYKNSPTGNVLKLQELMVDCYY